MAQNQTSFSERTNTLLSMAKDLSQEFGAHVAVIEFSPTGEPKAYGAPTADSILRTCLPEIHSSPFQACSKTMGEATARVDGMKREAEETAFLDVVERARQATSWMKILA
uniref:MADS-box domain-containing protein n=1 Tax=Setaria italica TaxID=4555 RepID=A0A0Q3VTL7_SETIT